ncbi:TRAP transporter small permease [uncultured Maribacter sp.]|uniref:TRAP transporter small permease n=1 Tax=uncultured Maribacter sp. TaxID=431308 RepID=UPI0026392261|nr:TRAP transporter small permease [uncultured Maribacter sp.]
MKKRINTFFKYGTLLGTLGFIISTIIQIYSRFFMEKPPSWTEEASRFFFIYAVSFAAGLAMKDKSYVFFDGLYNTFSDSFKPKLTLFISIITSFLFTTFTIYSLKFVILGIPEKSPSMEIPMAIGFASMTLMGISITYYSIIDLIKRK